MHSTTDLCRFLYKLASALAMALLTCTHNEGGDRVVMSCHALLLELGATKKP